MRLYQYSNRVSCVIVTLMLIFSVRSIADVGDVCTGCGLFGLQSGIWKTHGNPTYNITYDEVCTATNKTPKCNYAGETSPTATCNCVVAQKTKTDWEVTGELDHEFFGYSSQTGTSTLTNVTCSNPVTLNDFCQKCKIRVRLKYSTKNQTYKCERDGTTCYTKSSSVKTYQGVVCERVPYTHPDANCNPPPNPACPGSSGSN